MNAILSPFGLNVAPVSSEEVFVSRVVLNLCARVRSAVIQLLGSSEHAGASCFGDRTGAAEGEGCRGLGDSGKRRDGGEVGLLAALTCLCRHGLVA